MKDWLIATFPAGPNGLVMVYTSDTGVTGFDPTDPAGMFSTIMQTPPSHAALSALPCAPQGWQKVFDQWLADGLIAA